MGQEPQCVCVLVLMRFLEVIKVNWASAAEQKTDWDSRTVSRTSSSVVKPGFKSGSKLHIGQRRLFCTRTNLWAAQNKINVKNAFIVLHVQSFKIR